MKLIYSLLFTMDNTVADELNQENKLILPR